MYLVEFWSPRHGAWSGSSEPGVLSNIWYPPEPHPKLKSRKILFISYLIGLIFCTEYDSDSALFRTKFLKNVQLVFARFHFKMSFGRISYIAQSPRLLHIMHNVCSIGSWPNPKRKLKGSYFRIYPGILNITAWMIIKPTVYTGCKNWSML